MPAAAAAGAAKRSLLQRASLAVPPAAKEAAAAEVERQLQLAEALERVFGDPRWQPDLEAGCISAIHAPGGSSSNGSSNGGTQQSLLRVELAAPKQAGSRHGPPAPRYLAVPRSAAEALADAPTPDARLALLQDLQEFRLVGRQQAQLAALVQAVQQRRQQAVRDAWAARRARPNGAGRSPAAAGGKEGPSRAPARRSFLIPQRSSLQQQADP